MIQQVTQKDRLTMAIIALIAGILCFTLLPYLGVQAMDAVLKGAAVKIPASGNPLLATAPRIVITFFPVWTGLSAAAGLALLLVARAIHQGESWARPAAIGLLAIPSITGAYFSGPIMFFAKSAMPIFIIVALIGLIPYFFLLLWGKAPAGEKVGRFFLFLMLGVTSAWSFSNGGSSLRMFWARPEENLLGPSQYGFLFGFPVVWIGVVVTVISIAYLAAGTRKGWRLALVGLSILLVGNAYLYISHTMVNEFLYGIIMALVSLVLLSLPAIGGKLGVREPAVRLQAEAAD